MRFAVCIALLTSCQARAAEPMPQPKAPPTCIAPPVFRPLASTESPTAMAERPEWNAPKAPHLRDVGLIEVPLAVVAERLPRLAKTYNCDVVRVLGRSKSRVVAVCTRALIRPQGTNQYSIDERLWKSIRLSRQARIVKARLNGVVAGVRLYSMRKGSLLSTLGFRNGDQILSVNGERIDRARMEAITSERGRLKFEMIRRGRPHSLEIVVVDAK